MDIAIQARTLKGKKVAQLRKESKVPAVVYGKHLKQPIDVVCDKNEFLAVYRKAGMSTALTLKGDKIDQLVLIHDIQVDPVTDYVIHVDFLAVSRDEKVTAEVPVILTGASLVEKNSEGKIQVVKDTIQVEAFPQDLPHNVSIDISAIQNVNDVIFVKDIDLGKKVTILEDQDQPVVTVLLLTEETEEASTTAAVPAADAPKEEKKG